MVEDGTLGNSDFKERVKEEKHTEETERKNFIGSVL